MVVKLPSMVNRFGQVDLEGKFSGPPDAPSYQSSDPNSFILSDRGGRDNKTIYEQIKRWRRKHRQEKATPTRQKKVCFLEEKPEEEEPINEDLVFEAALTRQQSCKEKPTGEFGSMDALSRLTILSERVDAEQAVRSPGELQWIDSEACRAAEEESEDFESDQEDEVYEIPVDSNWRERLEEAMLESLELQSRLRSQINTI